MDTKAVNSTREAPPAALEVERSFPHGRQKVWRALLEPELFAGWWGGADWRVVSAQIDPRLGGKFFYEMHSNTGLEIWGTGVFVELDPPSRVIMTDQFADRYGNPVHGSEYGMEPDFPLKLLIKIELVALAGGGTRVILRHEGMPVGEDTRMAVASWEESFDKLARILDEMQ